MKEEKKYSLKKGEWAEINGVIDGKVITISDSDASLLYGDELIKPLLLNTRIIIDGRNVSFDRSGSMFIMEFGKYKLCQEDLDYLASDKGIERLFINNPNLRYLELRIVNNKTTIMVKRLQRPSINQRIGR